jgi:hypothetical protein
MRTAGPNGMKLVGPRSAGMNDRAGASSVQADQDVFGTPMAQLMDGRAPELFLHDSPDGHNHDASLLLVNLWIPLQQIRSGYVFNTLSTAHGAGALPGEDVAEWCYRALEVAESAVARGDAAELVEAVSARHRPDLPISVTPALRDAVEAMTLMLDEALGNPLVVCGERAEEWSAASRAARRRVVRMSLEMRMVVSVERCSDSKVRP